MNCIRCFEPINGDGVETVIKLPGGQTITEYIHFDCEYIEDYSIYYEEGGANYV